MFYLPAGTCTTIEKVKVMTRLEAQSRCAELNRRADSDPGVHWMPRERLPDHWTPIRVRFGFLRPPRTNTTDAETGSRQLRRV
jgi:hypothetical protein